MTEQDAIAAAEKSSPLGDILSWMNGWGTIGLVFIVSLVGWIFWRLNKGATPFRVGDALIDPMTGKASILRIGFFVMLAATLVVILFGLMRGEDVKTFTLTALGIFVTPLIAARGFEVIDPRVKSQAEAMSTPPSGPPPSSSADADIKTEHKT